MVFNSKKMAYIKADKIPAILTVVVVTWIFGLFWNWGILFLSQYLNVDDIGVLSVFSSLIRSLLGVGLGVFLYNQRQEVSASAVDGALIGGLGMVLASVLSNLFVWVMLRMSASFSSLNPAWVMIQWVLIDGLIGIVLGAAFAVIWPKKRRSGDE